MQERIDDLNKAGIGVAAISYDAPDVLKAFAERGSITFPLLSDADSKTIVAYGIKNQGVEAGSKQDGIPHPGTFLVDDEGVIRAKLFYSIRKRHTPDELLDAVKKAGE